MKRILLPILVIGILLLSACVETTTPPSPSPTPTPTPAPTPTPTPTPTPAPNTGNLEGSVLYRCNKQPASGYYVYLFPGSEGSASAIGVHQVDENGLYRFTNLKAGSYRLTADEEADVKGLTCTHAKAKARVAATTAVKDILIWFCPDLKPTSPINGALVTTSRPTFKWEPYIGAVAYEVNVQAESGDRYHFPEYPPGTNETTATIPEDLPPGYYEWYIWAYDDISKLTPIGESHRWRFIISTP